MNISGTLELITNTDMSFSIGDMIAIVVSVISFVGVIISTIMTNKTTKKISKDSLSNQDKWNQKNIDANLISSARIEWIQNVRKSSAELLLLYYRMINHIGVEDIENTFLESQEKNELLILYFGKDSDDDRILNKEALLCAETNNGKNNLIVEMLVDLSNRFGHYAEDVKSGKIDNLKEILQETRNNMYQNAKLAKIGETYIEEIGEYQDVHEPVCEEVDVEDYSRALFSLQAEEEKIKTLQAELLFFRDVIRTYLKVEWEIAKNGR